MVPRPCQPQPQPSFIQEMNIHSPNQTPTQSYIILLTTPVRSKRNGNDGIHPWFCLLVVRYKKGLDSDSERSHFVNDKRQVRDYSMTTRDKLVMWYPPTSSRRWMLSIPGRVVSVVALSVVSVLWMQRSERWFLHFQLFIGTCHATFQTTTTTTTILQVSGGNRSRSNSSDDISFSLSASSLLSVASLWFCVVLWCLGPQFHWSSG